MDLKIGCDPEIFLAEPGGKIVSAEGLVPGTKAEPFKVRKGTVQVDGFAAEIGIEPAETPAEFADNVMTVLDELRRIVPGHTFVYTDAHVFDEGVYLKQSDAGRALGCDPDYNAYTKVENPMPVPNPKTLRTAAGHIHLGWDNGLDTNDPGHFIDCINVAKQMDWALGCPSLAWSLGTRRRALYGQAGCFRPKTYGCEYRTLDNAWLHSRDRMEYVASNAIIGMKALYNSNHYCNKYTARVFINQAEQYRGYAGVAPYIEALKLPAPPGVAVEKPMVKKKVNFYG